MVKFRILCSQCQQQVDVAPTDIHMFVCVDNETWNRFAFPCEPCGLQTEVLDKFKFVALNCQAVPVSYFTEAEVLAVQAGCIRDFADGLDSTLDLILGRAS